jgi:G3E family GTPase
MARAVKRCGPLAEDAAFSGRKAFFVMHLIVITGFLGSGKTTLIVKLVKAAMQKGLRVAVVVNEIGEIGIDDQFMKKIGLDVWEILGGCICCTLAGDLVRTLQELHGNYSPDVVIVEPSGAADPGNLFSALGMSRIQFLTGTRRIALLDPLRMDMLMAVLEPLVTSAIRQADLILINKADIASPEQIEQTRRVAADTNPVPAVMVISAKDDLEPRVLSEILSWLT